MSWRFVKVAALCLVAIAAGCETAPVYRPGVEGAALPAVVERPGFTPGDEFWFWSPGEGLFAEVFDGEEDDLLAFRRPSRQETIYLSRDLALVKVRRPFGTDLYFRPDDGLLSFPLSLGKSWSRSFRAVTSGAAPTVRFTRRCEVIDAGEAEVPAGRFAALRIECTLREQGRRPAHELVLYAPEVGRVILHRSDDRGTDLRLTEVVRAK